MKDQNIMKKNLYVILFLIMNSILFSQDIFISSSQLNQFAPDIFDEEKFEASLFLSERNTLKEVLLQKKINIDSDFLLYESINTEPGIKYVAYIIDFRDHYFYEYTGDEIQMLKLDDEFIDNLRIYSCFSNRQYIGQATRGGGITMISSTQHNVFSWCATKGWVHENNSDLYNMDNIFRLVKKIKLFYSE